MNSITKKSGYQIEDSHHIGETIVSWIITHACQEKCAYCISPNKTTEITSKDDHFAIQNKLISDGLTKNRYIGGEPLLIPHIAELIADAHEKGVNTRLSTNGVMLTEKVFKSLKSNLDSIAFPFESLNDELNTKIRGSSGKSHRQVVTAKIAMVKDTSDIGVLINTCVHKENINYLDELGAFLDGIGVDHWKLRRFNSSSGRGAVPNKKRFDISDAEFFEKVNTLQQLYPNLRIDGRLPSKLASRLMISPQGDLYRMQEEGKNDIKYGNLLHDNLNIKEISKRDMCD